VELATASAPNGLQNYYQQLPTPSTVSRARSVIASAFLGVDYDAGDDAGLILGMVNEASAGVPGVLRISILDWDGPSARFAWSSMQAIHCRTESRQARVPLPRSTEWKGLRV
jgi:hypothetical protein